MTDWREKDAGPAQRLAQIRREFGEFGGVNASIENSTTFTGCYLYARSFNPTVRYLGRQLAALEGTEAGYATSSGMAAISSVLFNLCNAGDHIIASNTVYGGTFALMKDFLPLKVNVTTTFVPINDLAAVKAAITTKTKVIYTETVSNPTCVVANLPELAAIAHERGISFVVDNTFSPLIISPAKWGADVVVHSMTKFMSGASDIVAGAVCGTVGTIQSLMDLHLGPIMLLGPTMDPKVASELHLRIPNQSIRMAGHSRLALAYAQVLQKAGAKVVYPGLPDHPDHELMNKLRNEEYGWGGILTLDMGTQKAAEAFMERLQNKHAFGFMAVSLGYFDTLMSCSGSSTSSELTDSEKDSAGISAGLVRMSVGITGTLEERCNQLLEAYKTCTSALNGEANQKLYRAAQVVRNEFGKLTRVASWDSMGSSLDNYEEAPDLAGPLSSAEDGGEVVRRPSKIRRIGEKDVLYELIVPESSPDA